MPILLGLRTITAVVAMAKHVFWQSVNRYSKVQRLQLYMPCLAKMYCRKGREGAALQTNIYLQNKHN